MARAIVTVPKAARAGEVIEVRAVVAHAMESGYRTDSEGRIVPRDIIRRFECRWAGELVFAADLHPAFAANPLLVFHAVAPAGGGPLACTWTGDNGFAHTETVTIAAA